MQMVNTLLELRRDKFTIVQQEKVNLSSIASLYGSEIKKTENNSVDKLKCHLDDWVKTLPDQPGLERTENCSVHKLKRYLDDWVKIVPDQPRGGGYSERVATESNSIQHKAWSLRNRR